MSSERCEYQACGEAALHEVQFDGRKHWLCERHVRPEYHPPDLHKKLPGGVLWRALAKVRKAGQ